MSLEGLHKKLGKMWKKEKDPKIRSAIASIGNIVRRDLERRKKFEGEVKDAFT